MTAARTAPPIPNRLELPLSEGYSLRVDFDRAHDRWAHRVLLVVPEGSGIVGPVLLLESMEGTSEEDWPVSPPLQFVSIEMRPKKPPVALLMGMSGDGHWSASIEQLPEEGTLRFDIACRAKSQPENLGSRYRFGLRAPFSPVSDSEHVLTLGSYDFKISGEHAPDAPLPELSTSGNELQVQFTAAVSAEAQTYRWIYRLTASQHSAS